jgi:Flp pilus assembly pilin Flp
VAVAGRSNTRGSEKAQNRGLAALRSNERGAQLVEFALILPILMALLLGIVTGGIAFSHNLSIDNAARETARFGATLPVNANMAAYLNQVADVAIETSTGTLEDGAPGRVVCVAYVYPDGTLANDRTTSIVEDAGGARAVSNQPCLIDGRPNDERRVQITVAREADLVVFYFSRTVTLTGQSVARFERGDA